MTRARIRERTFRVALIKCRLGNRYDKYPSAKDRTSAAAARSNDPLTGFLRCIVGLMCYTDKARPPLPPIRGGASNQADIELTAADGNKFMAYAARATQPAGRGMVILPDVRGLFPFYKELAVRFAEAGFEAVAFDYFGRTTQGKDRSESFNWQEHIPKTTPEMVAADVRACVEYLRSAEGGRPKAIFSVGFCWAAPPPGGSRPRVVASLVRSAFTAANQ